MKNKGAKYIWFDGEFIEWEKASIPIHMHYITELQSSKELELINQIAIYIFFL